METKITVLTPFFKNPDHSFHIREVAKIIGMSHTAVRKHLAALHSEGCVIVRQETPYNSYKANTSSKKFLNLKLYYNLEKLRESAIIEELEQIYNYPCIVIFGSYAKAFDDTKSDVDICIISEVKKEMKEKTLKQYEKSIQRQISIHLFDRVRWKETKTRNPELINSICNGFVVSGQLEVL